MAIRFRCECGKVLMASDDQAGLEGQCPACERILTIPETDNLDLAGVLDVEEPTEALAAGQVDEEGAREEIAGEMEGLEALERDLEERAEYRHGKRSWSPSSRVVMLASILVVFLVAFVVFMVVLREKETPQEPILIKKIEPVIETEEEATTPAVGAKLEEEATLPQEEQPIASPIAEGEPSGQAPTEPTPGEEAGVPPEEKKPETVASIKVEAPPVKKGPPVGAYTINVASFKQKENAERYAEQLKGKGIDAFDWEIDLPKKGRWYRVSVGSFSTRQEAESYAGELRQKGITDVFVTKVPGTS